MSRWRSCEFNKLQKIQEQTVSIEKETDIFCRNCADELAGRVLDKSGN